MNGHAIRVDDSYHNKHKCKPCNQLPTRGIIALRVRFGRSTALEGEVSGAVETISKYKSIHRVLSNAIETSCR